MRILIRVRPRASSTRVGGSVGERLIVAVTEAAIDGKATKAATLALAKALGVRAYELQLVRGETSRDKDFDLLVDANLQAAVAQRLAELKG